MYCLEKKHYLASTENRTTVPWLYRSQASQRTEDADDYGDDIHSFRSMSYVMYIAASEASSLQRAIQCFLKVLAHFRFLEVIHQLLKSSSSSCRPFCFSLSTVSQKPLPTQDVTNKVNLSSSYFMQDRAVLMIHLFAAIELSPSGSSTVHIYTQTIHRTTQK